MKRVCMISWAACAACLFSPAVWATDFTLGFQGADSFSGSVGDAWSGSYASTLTSAGGGNGAQGWSVSMTADNAKIDSIDFAGTDAAAIYTGGFKKSETTSGAGNEGAVSAIVLSLTQDKSLPADSTSTIVKIGVSGTIPSGGGSATLRYVDNRKGSGQPVPNSVTQDGATVKPALTSKDISLREVVSCCGKLVNVGFTDHKVSSATPYDGLADDGTGLCSGGGGQIVVLSDAGATGSKHIFADISSTGAGAGVQGWSFSLALNGDMDFGAGGVTIAGTSTEAHYSGGFKKTETIDPAKNGGQRGAVSAIVLSLTQDRTLPPTGTESVLDLSVQAVGSQADADIVGSLRFLNNLKGSGQPVKNALTVGGETKDACNVPTAGVEMVFRLRPIPPISQFVRGNANDDGKVDIADPIFVINQLFRAGSPSACQDAADANDDGMVDAGDAAYLITYLFGPVSAAPPTPFPACGPDPSDDTLPCPTGSVSGCP